MVIVVMGPSGSGKTTVGQALADACSWRFVEGDDLHPQANVEKMRSGLGLTDADRAPWLTAIRQVIEDTLGGGRSAVVACSALKQRYRDVLSGGLDGVRFVYLRADRQTLEQRLAARTGHFAGPALVDSQLATLEEPSKDVLTVDARQSPDAIVREVRNRLEIC